MEKIIAQGAEAVLILEDGKLIKRRTKKGYRIPVLDEKLRKQRTKRESKLLEKASKLINVPKIIRVSDKEKEIDMEFIEGKKLSEHLDNLRNAEEVCRQIGESIAKLHDADIIHGDLTTSNMICDSTSLHTLRPKVYFIDFGLGYESSKVEDKAVDLHLIKQALEAKHFLHFESFFKAILKGYEISKNHIAVVNRLKAVEKRGRYKQAC